MPFWRLACTVAGVGALNLNLTTCRSNSEAGAAPVNEPAPANVELRGIDTSALTPREKKDWSTYVNEILAPCADQPVSVAKCVAESRPCVECAAGAEFLVTRVRRGDPRAQVEAAFRARFSGDVVRQVEEGTSPTLGAKGAVVVIVEWADFECPHCAMVAPMIKKLVKAYPEHVRLVFKHYPLSAHENAELAARAAVAAGRQNRFWEMHAGLFAQGSAVLDRRAILELAQSLGLDKKQFVKDLESEAVADAVLDDKKQAEKLGLQGTPMIYVNGRHFELERFSPIEDLESWVKLEIKLRTGKDVVAVPVEASTAPQSP